MDAIKSGATLKHVDVEKKPVAHMDSRGELLDQIRQGVELKSVSRARKREPEIRTKQFISMNGLSNFLWFQVQQTEKPNGPSAPLDGIAGALARALAERSKAFHHDSDSDTDSEAEGDSDSEWDE